MFKRIPFDRVDWVNSSFLIGTSLIALIGTPFYFWHFGLGSFDLFQAAMMLFYLIATGLSITLGYHRLFSHLSFQAKWPVRLFTLAFGACAFENTVINWASDHRRHHKHTDHDDDPYDITKGFFWAHMGWIMFKLNPEPPINNVKDLERDPLVRWQARWYVPLAVGLGLLFPALLGFFWNGIPGALGGFLFAGVLRVVLVQHSTFFINSLCHTVGRQPYSSKCSARDSTLMAFFTFGEGYHNYHHEFQHDYRNGVKPWQWDPTKWTIILLERCKLVSGLRRVPEARIVRAEMAQAWREAERRLKAYESANESVCEKTYEKLKEVHQRLSENLSQVEIALRDKITISKQKLNDWRTETSELVNEILHIRVDQHT